MKYIKGDITTIKSGYILQQCDCVTITPHGLSLTLDQAFPGTCPYRLRKAVRPDLNVATKETRSTPGTVMILGTDKDVCIINLFGQCYPEKAMLTPNIDETLLPDKETDREMYFIMGLEALVDYFEGSESTIRIAVPYKIGCGSAGGNWDHYKQMLIGFEQKMKEMNIDLELTIYHPD